MTRGRFQIGLGRGSSVLWECNQIRTLRPVDIVTGLWPRYVWSLRKSMRAQLLNSSWRRLSTYVGKVDRPKGGKFLCLSEVCILYSSSYYMEVGSAKCKALSYAKKKKSVREDRDTWNAAISHHKHISVCTRNLRQAYNRKERHMQLCAPKRHKPRAERPSYNLGFLRWRGR
jgi:hypothetical protein